MPDQPKAPTSPPPKAPPPEQVPKLPQTIFNLEKKGDTTPESNRRA